MSLSADEDLLFRFRARYQKSHGTVDMTAKGVRWFNTESSIWIPIASIEKHEVSPRSHPKAMLRISRKAGSPAILTMLEASPDRAYKILCSAKATLATILKSVNKRSGSSSSAGKKRKKLNDEKDDESNEIESTVYSPIRDDDTKEGRRSRLRADSRLSTLYRELVGGGIMSEDQFWMGREKEVGKRIKKKKVVITNDLMVDAPPDNSTETTVTYKMSKQKQRYVFEMYPAVQRAHKALVGKSLTEEEFWIKYFQSKFFLRDKGEAVTRSFASDRHTESIDDDLFARYEKDDDLVLKNKPNLQVGDTLQRTIDDADINDTDLEPPPLQSSGLKLGPVTPSAIRVLKKVNRHSDFVVGSINKDFNNAQYQDTYENDLNAEPSPSFISLSVHTNTQDPSLRAEAKHLPSPDATTILQWTLQDVQPIHQLVESHSNAAPAFAFLLRKSKTPADDKPPPQPFRGQAEDKALLASNIVNFMYKQHATASPQSLRPKLLSLRQDIDAMRTSLRESPPLGASHAALLKPIADQLNHALNSLSSS